MKPVIKCSIICFSFFFCLIAAHSEGQVRSFPESKIYVFLTLTEASVPDSESLCEERSAGCAHLCTCVYRCCISPPSVLSFVWHVQDPDQVSGSFIPDSAALENRSLSAPLPLVSVFISSISFLFFVPSFSLETQTTKTSAAFELWAFKGREKHNLPIYHNLSSAARWRRRWSSRSLSELTWGEWSRTRRKKETCREARTWRQRRSRNEGRQSWNEEFESPLENVL